ncbi:MAG: asparagine synthase [Halioglobus sp.]|nr:asparagine synthase [Halioglobus sp.]
MKTGSTGSHIDRREDPSLKGILGVVSGAGEDSRTRGLTAFTARPQDAPDAIESNADGHTLQTTGEMHALPNGGAVATYGRPRFRDSELANLADESNAAAALAAGYDEHSQDIFCRMSGAYSCAIIDSSEQRVLLCIDRLGQHSLYFSSVNGGLIFGSYADRVLAGTSGNDTLFRQGVYNYIYFHMVPCPDCIYPNLHKLSAAHYLDYSGEGYRLVNYWQPSFSEALNPPSLDRLKVDLKRTLRSSVERSLGSAKNIGSFLSGGLDSSTVTGVLAELSGREAEAFSIGFSAEGYDEMDYARLTAKHFGVKLNEYYVTPEDVVNTLPLIANSYDEPFGNSSALPAYFCAKMATEHGIDVLLAGDGGDEIFAGNERYIKQRAFYPYTRVPRGLRQVLLEPLVSALPTIIPMASKARSYIAQAKTPLPDRLQSYNFLHRHPVEEIFQANFLTEIDPQQPLALLRSIFDRPDTASELNRMLYLDWQITLADNDLRKVSHMCALAGVDVVYPMLDDELIELSCRVPSTLKIKGSNLRHFFKIALQDWLPHETINKSKQGFGLPFGVWMQTYKPLRELAYDSLMRLKKREFIRSDFIEQTIRMHRSEHAAYYGELVWILTVFELWLDGRDAKKNQTPENNS